jgi:hypothetical protein
MHGARSFLFVSLGVLALATAPVGATSLHPGDVVMIAQEHNASVPHNAVAWVARSGGAYGVLAEGPPISDPRDIAVRHDGTVLVADAVSGLLAINAASGAISVLVDAAHLGGSGPTALTLTSSDDVVMAGAWGVQRLAPGSTSPQRLSGTGLMIDPRGIAADGTGVIWVSDYEAGAATSGGHNAGGIIRVDPVGGVQSFLGIMARPDTFPENLSTLRVGSDGQFYVTNTYSGSVGKFGLGGIYRVDPANGASAIWFTDPWVRGFLMDPGQDAIVLYAYDLNHTPFDGVLGDFDGTTFNWWQGGLPVGPISQVPAGATPAVQKSWGQVKVDHR